MTTKYPATGNQVISARGVRGRRTERGIALVSVIAVLVLLAMVATPFLLTMRDSAARGEKFLYGTRAESEAEGVFELCRSELVNQLEHIERRRFDSLGAQQDVSGQRAPAGATPTYDTPEEFALPASVIESFNRSTAKEHRVWAADIVDTQTLFNLNSCSYPVLANMLGRAEVATVATADATTIKLTRVPETFPKEGGVVRIGPECVKYKQIVGSDLTGCERGYMASTPGNSAAQDLEIGDVVIPESCFQIATRPFRLRKDDKANEAAWVRYTNIDQARTISDMGVATLPPNDFELLRPYVTAWNGNAVGDGWCNPQLVRNAITSSDANKTLVAKMKNVRYFGPGTMVRITDGVNSDYGVVTKVRGSDQVILAARILHDYTADQTRIYCLARSPINVNTADVATLKLCFNGLRLRGKTVGVNERQAEDLAFYLKQWRPKAVAGAKASDKPVPPGVFRGWEDLTLALEDARDAGKLDQDSFRAVMLNGMNANDSLLAFSTVPFVFRSYDTYEVRARVSLQGAGGREMARRELRRVMEVSTTKSGTFVLETQEDFQNQIIKSRDAKYMTTYPANVNARYEGLNIPPSEYRQFSEKNLFPSTDRTLGISFVQSAPGSLRFTQGNRIDNVEHFDEEKTPDGYDLKDNAYVVSVDGPYEPTKGKLDLIDTTDIDGLGGDIELGMKEFACAFWYRPEWERDSAEHVIFDYGNDNDHMNRVSLRYDPQREDGALVLAVADATREQRSCEVIYTFDHGTWLAKEWYHIAVHVAGCSPELMQLFIDGEEQGRSNIQTRLKSAIPGTSQATSDSYSISVEDARHFPATGVLMVRGDEGFELMEYSSKSENTFIVSRRKARTIDYPSDNVARGHKEGSLVTLYGFTAPLYSDIKRGGATTDAQIGPWRPYRFNQAGDRVRYTLSGNTFIDAVGLANPATATGTITATLSDWDTGSVDATMLQELGASGTEGIAMIVAGRFEINATIATITASQNGVQVSDTEAASAVELGGVEFVRYTVGSTPGEVQLTARNLQLRHAAVSTPSDGKNRFMPTYSYAQDGQSVNNAWTVVAGDVNKGFQTAFIPIGLVVRGASSGQYLDPQDREDQLQYYDARNYDNSPFCPIQGQTMRRAFVQVEGEWIAYDTFDTSTTVNSAGKASFYRDMTLLALCAISPPTGGTTAPIQPWNNASGCLQYFGNANPSNGVGGGTGAGSNDVPPEAQDKNRESDTTGKAVVATAPSGQNLPAPTVNSVEIAKALDFRGYENTQQVTQWGLFRVAATIPRSHAANTAVIPCFAVALGGGNTLERWGFGYEAPAAAGGSTSQANTQIPNPPDDLNVGPRGAYPGFNDLVTLRDTRGSDLQIRLQWGWRNWCAPTTALFSDWNWDRPQTPEGQLTGMKRWDSRAWTRLLKFPSAEMPDSGLTKAKQDFVFGRKYDASGGTAPAFIDEIQWKQIQRPAKTRPDYAFLGTVPPTIVAGTATSGSSNIQFPGIDAEVDEFTVHLPFVGSGGAYYPGGLPIDDAVYPDDGGIIKIDDELILYEQFDPASGRFSGCQRGVLGTEAGVHEYGAMVVAIECFPASRLTAPVDTSAGSYQIADGSDFPDDGYMRIGESGEIIGYTNWTQTLLSGPLARFDEKDGKSSDKKAAGAIFRSRFGTVAESGESGAVAIGMPWRYPDRYAERADDPEQSYLQLSWTKQGAVWKRITWDAEPKTNVQVVALLRFAGGPAWDADKVIHVGQDAMPSEDRRQWLYQITDPKAENLLNVEADRVEVRLGMRYAKGAYDRTADVAPDNWKQAPSIRKVVVEYVAPPQVLTQE